MEVFKIWTSLEVKGNALAEVEKLTRAAKAAGDQITGLNRRLSVLGNRLDTVERKCMAATLQLTKFSKVLDRVGISSNLASESLGRFAKSMDAESSSAERTVNRNKRVAESISSITKAQSSLNNIRMLTHTREISDVIRVDRKVYGHDDYEIDPESKNRAESAFNANKKYYRRHVVPYQINHMPIGYQEMPRYHESVGSGFGGGKEPPFSAFKSSSEGDDKGRGGSSSVVGTTLGAGALGGLAGMAATAGIEVGFHTVKTGFEQNKEYQQQLTQLRSQGLSKNQINQAIKLSQHTMPGVSTLDMMKGFNDAFMATRDFGEAIKIAPELAKITYTANSTFGGMTDQQMKNLVRFAEFGGGSDPQKILEWLKIGYQTMSMSAGSIMPTQLRTFGRQAPGLIQNMAPLGFLGLEPVLQELGESRTGTAFTTGIRDLIGGGTGPGLMAKYKVDDLRKLGLVINTSYDKQGRPLGYRMRKKDAELLQSDPFEYMKERYLPALQKSGVNIKDYSAVARKMELDLPRTMAMAFEVMFKNIPKIEKQRAMVSKMLGIDTTYNLVQKTQAGSVKRLSKAFDSLALSINQLASPTVIKELNRIAYVFEKLAISINWINRHKSWFTPQNITPWLDQKTLDKIQNKQKNNISSQDISIKPDQKSVAHNFLQKKDSILEGFFPYQDKSNKKSIHEVTMPNTEMSKISTGTSSPTGWMDSLSSIANSIENHFKNESKKKQTQTTGDVYLDGKKVGKIVMQQMTKDANGAGTLGGNALINMSLTPVPAAFSDVGS